jgi:hypothetical protein
MDRDRKRDRGLGPVACLKNDGSTCGLMNLHYYYEGAAGQMERALLRATQENCRIARPAPTAQQSVGEHNRMNYETTPVLMRVFRVTYRHGKDYSRWIVLENVERAQFRGGGHLAVGGVPTRRMRATADRDDAWDALNSLRNIARLQESDENLWPEADSIDAAISKEETRMQDLRTERFSETHQVAGNRKSHRAKDPNDR